jgi:Holliday junction resolvase RusA-like endonuclease
MKFTIPGEPTGKARPRVTRWGTHNTEKTILYENLVKMCYQEQCNTYTEKPLKAYIEIYYGIPKSTPKKNIELMLDGEIRPCKKPDIDNVCKIIFDALNGIAYKDDTQIIQLYATKYYGEAPHVSVMFDEVPLCQT